MEFLQGLTQEELFNRANRNGLTLMDISADLEAAHGEIEDLKNQWHKSCNVSAAFAE